MDPKIYNLLFYTVFVAAAVAGEYFKLLPMGSLSLVLGLVGGHNFAQLISQFVPQIVVPASSTVTTEATPTNEPAK